MHAERKDPDYLLALPILIETTPVVVPIAATKTTIIKTMKLTYTLLPLQQLPLLITTTIIIDQQQHHHRQLLLDPQGQLCGGCPII
jgi:hypothetical protein